MDSTNNKNTLLNNDIYQNPKKIKFNQEENRTQRNTINEEDDEGLDQSYAMKEIKKTERPQSKTASLKNESEFDEDGVYHNIYQDIEPDEENDQELIDFNNQNAYESDNSRESHKAEDQSQEEIDFDKNNTIKDDENEEDKVEKENQFGKFFNKFLNKMIFIFLLRL